MTERAYTIKSINGQSVLFREATFEELKPLTSCAKESVAFHNGSNVFYIGAFIDGEIVGVVGYQMIGSVLRYKTDCVAKEYRGIGIYSELFNIRDMLCVGKSKRTTAMCTSKSLPTYIKRGFKVVSVKNNITFVERWQ